HRLEISWHSVTLYEPGRAPAERTSLHRVRAPRRSGDTITWASHALGCAFTCDAQLPAASIPLLDDARGRIAWRCEAPAARVRATTPDGPPVDGTGYAECLVMTVLPWQLPLEQLRWGRWISRDARHSVVWIDWRGDRPSRWALVDGIARTDVIVRDDGIAYSGAALPLPEPRTLHERRLGDIVGPIRPLAALLPEALLSMREQKWCGRAELRDGQSPPAAGWAIHELVQLR
ncbi:MAG: hypothetical protein ACYC3L_05980, partial [Gemmatimonadaceae bacterium]